MKLDDDGKEDLMTQAVSLVERIEIRCRGIEEFVVLGFNTAGWLFVYLGDDPMYRFDELGQLRRAFVKGMLFRTEGETLSSMERIRSRDSDSTEHQLGTTLIRRDLSEAELSVFRDQIFEKLNLVLEGLRRGEVTRQHTQAPGNIVQKFIDGVKVVLEAPVFLAPAIVRR